MTTDIHSQRVAAPADDATRPALLGLLEARSVAIVGASARSGSFGARMLAEVGKSPSGPAIFPVNPRYPEIDGQRCYASLADLPEPVDLVLLGVPDAALEQQLTAAADLGCKSAVIFGNAHEEADPGAEPARPSRYRQTPAVRSADGSPQTALRHRLTGVAQAAGMELCGAGCMGFANVTHGLRALGYVEADPLPSGPVALVTHSGSVFSALLRTRRAFGFTLAVSSGQELVTAAPSYLSYAIAQPETKVLALVLEAIRQPALLRQVLAQAAERDLPVILLTAGNSATGRAMVAAHSGALAGSDGGWEALARAYGVHRVSDLAELCDTLELFTQLTRTRARGRSPAPPQPTEPGQSTEPGRSQTRRGIATVHDSGLERAHAADLADELAVPFAEISPTTRARLAALLDPGLIPANPLDVWGTGADPRELFGNCMTALAQDESVDAVALAVDLVTELDGDESYPLAVLDVAQRTTKPVAVISNVPSAIDLKTAALLRDNGVPVLEGMRTGLLAFRHLLDHLAQAGLPPQAPAPPPADPARLTRARTLLNSSTQTGTAALALLTEYGIDAASSVRVNSADEAAAAATTIGYPVVLKTDEPGIAHKSDAGGVLLGIADEAELLAGYADLATRLGPAALVCQTVPPGVELALGIITTPDLGPLIVVGAGGVLVELISDRAVALPPVSQDQAIALLNGLKIRKLLAGVRGAKPADLTAVARAITALSDLAIDLADDLEALDINPLICGPTGAIAADALIIGRDD